MWLSFHYDTTELQEKKKMIKELVNLQEYLMQKWHNITSLNIWWGYRIKYCTGIILNQSPKEYYQWWWVYWVNFLDELLDYEIDEQPFYEYLNESFTTLIVEPWRALLDQSGILVHTIIDKNEKWIIIDGNIYSTGSIAQEMPHDPLLFYSKNGLHFTDYSKDNVSVTIYGNLCLESDIIYSRTISFQHEPQIWDKVICVNTAWYFADFSDSQPIGQTDRKTIFM